MRRLFMKPGGNEPGPEGDGRWRPDGPIPGDGARRGGVARPRPESVSAVYCCCWWGRCWIRALLDVDRNGDKVNMVMVVWLLDRTACKWIGCCFFTRKETDRSEESVGSIRKLLMISQQAIWLIAQIGQRWIEAFAFLCVTENTC